jgi:syntaxin-binding protein 5
LNERTEKLNMMGDNMENLQNNSAGWADDVNKYLNKQKRNVVLGGLKSKFF